MATYIICAIILGIIIFSVKDYLKKLTSGCCGATVETKRKKSRKKVDLSEYKFSKIVNIEGMTCKNCVNHVENELNEIDNIVAKVDLKKNSASVMMKNNVEDSILKRAVERAGYRVKSIV